jgi:alkyl sulfatase BDS1-like metallo-beta-lactamase superfamily hydrolase
MPARRILLFVLGILAGCSPLGLPMAAAQVVDFTQSGRDLAEPIKINDAIYQGVGFGNTFLVLTDEGNVVIDTSIVGTAAKHHAMLQKISQAPIKYIILTHGHGDHTGGVYLWKQPDTQIIAHKNFVPFRQYQKRIQGYLNRTAAAQFNFDLKRLTSLADSPNQKVIPTITFDDKYEFELGGVKFEIFHTPGETPDALTVWIPKYKAAFVGDNLYDSFPNIYTLRGTTPRWPLEYIESLDKVLALQPELVLPSHGLPIQGQDKVTVSVTKYRDAIRYVHDATVQGMNDGKDVFTLMREIKLPAELDIGEDYGKVAWSVRGIYEGYVGWFDLNPASMYDSPPTVANADLVQLAGGASVVAAKARETVEAGDAVRGLRLADAALAHEPTNVDALEAKLLALKTLQAGTRNGLEHAWLGHGLRTTQAQLDAVLPKEEQATAN